MYRREGVNPSGNTRVPPLWQCRWPKRLVRKSHGPYDKHALERLPKALKHAGCHTAGYFVGFCVLHTCITIYRRVGHLSIAARKFLKAKRTMPQYLPRNVPRRLDFKRHAGVFKRRPVRVALKIRQQVRRCLAVSLVAGIGYTSNVGYQVGSGLRLGELRVWLWR